MNDSDIKGAFERMGPTPEAEDRMLANILATKSTVGQHAAAPKKARHAAAPKRNNLRALALPIAACLVVLAGIGMLVVGQAYFATLGNQLGDSGSSMQEKAVESYSASPEDASSSRDEASPSIALAPNGPAERFPAIELEDGTVLLIAKDGSSLPLIADEKLVGGEAQEATARSEDGATTEPCTVYAYANDKTPFAVRYPDDPTCYLAVPVE